MRFPGSRAIASFSPSILSLRRHDPHPSPTFPSLKVPKNHLKADQVTQRTPPHRRIHVVEWGGVGWGGVRVTDEIQHKSDVSCEPSLHISFVSVLVLCQCQPTLLADHIKDADEFLFLSFSLPSFPLFPNTQEGPHDTQKGGLYCRYLRMGAAATAVKRR